jgi:hypothetical protein
VTLKLPRVLAGRLRAVARRNGKSQAELIREGLALRLERESARGEGSVLDLIEDLVGAVEGPRDLGSNPKHLRGFGK